ncbi:hypothetical protein [Tessaracoccus flavus]|jgi:hypothetical protein|uniref:Uncharacterized protein n=1 Tax=Tessaracoccus flavus TaxID=1610493 RepID=A0A1Q2CCS3_9ACTN|nr:hypothetical protein [Tessaracoccus flavus]AQP43904.1 hypothetical protein RPIT_02980 [Tessaracoccus flavus]SDY28142.1 hypothetical protein SAMN05428934_101197 [Tessaracoccus flavus]
MKTTIDIPDALAVRAKRFVASGGPGTTLRDLVIAGLEAELNRRERPARVDFNWVTQDGQGLAQPQASTTDRPGGTP